MINNVLFLVLALAGMVFCGVGRVRLGFEALRWVGIGGLCWVCCWLR